MRVRSAPVNRPRTERLAAPDIHGADMRQDGDVPADHAALAALPRVDALVDAAGALVERHGRAAATGALRAAVASARAALLAGDAAGADPAALVTAATAALDRRRPGPPRRVVNAAGIVVHTNLGRAPLSSAARAAVADAAGYCDLEYELAEGVRGARTARLEPLLVDATGAQAGTAVNNAAAALVLVLAALASGRDVVVSRGELVEIGGSFRLPEVMAASGARLLEVGTTNRTRAADYAAACTRPDRDVALLLRVHPSNYRVTGFVETPTVPELAEVAATHGVPLVHDTGSGYLGGELDGAGQTRAASWLDGEPAVRDSLAEGSDLVLCSADKLLGGPQGGLLVGRQDLVERCRRHPLARALRLDKLRVAALCATLEAHVRGAAREVPTWAALTADEAPLRARAGVLAAAVGGEVVPAVTLVGGGSAPGAGVATPAVRVPTPAATAVAARLRAHDPPVVVRVVDGALLCDLRTVEPDDDAVLVAALRAALQPGG